jgi:hypothetical protein
MKLYTEEQVNKITLQVLTFGHYDASITPIELPSDEEVEIVSKEEQQLIPIDAHSFEVFAIKDCEESPTGKQAFIGFKISNGDFHFIGVPYTEPKQQDNEKVSN